MPVFPPQRTAPHTGKAAPEAPAPVWPAHAPTPPAGATQLLQCCDNLSGPPGCNPRDATDFLDGLQHTGPAMHLQLVNDRCANHLGSALIKETVVQLGGGHVPVCSRLPTSPDDMARGMVAAAHVSGLAVCASVGGNVFTNRLPWLADRHFLRASTELARCAPQRTFVFGHSISDSCRGLALRWLAHVLRPLSGVSVRDAHSHALLRSLGVSADLNWDVGFAYRPRLEAPAAGAALLERAGVDPHHCALLTLPDTNGLRPEERRQRLEHLATLATRLAWRGHQPVLMFISEPTEAQQALATQFCQQVPGVTLASPFALHDHHPLDAMAGALAVARIVVSTDYHATVLRLVAGRHALYLHDSPEGADLAQRLSLPSAPLAQLDPTLALRTAEATGVMGFDAHPLRDAVRTGFAWHLARAAAGRAAPSFNRPQLA